jgi:hypothetical protein
MHSPPKLGFDLGQLGAKALRDGPSLHLKVTLSRLSADMRKAQEIEAFRFALTTLASPLLGEAAKFNQAGFLRVQFQAKLGKALPESLLESLGFLAPFEAHHDVVNIPNEADIAPAVTLTPLVSP